MFFYFIPLFMFFSSFICFIAYRKHLLMMLLCFEALVLSLVFMMMLIFSLFSQLNLFIIFVVLTFGACEASLGLAILVSMTRSFGTDMCHVLSLKKC